MERRVSLEISLAVLRAELQLRLTQMGMMVISELPSLGDDSTARASCKRKSDYC